jgi:hypothetical protein
MAEQDKARLEWFEPELERRANEAQRLEKEIAGLTAAMAEQDKVRLEWFEPELERRAKAAQRLEAELQQRADVAQRLEAELASAAQQALDLRRLVATHQRQSLFYARELATTVAELKRTKDVSDALWLEKESWFVPREAQFLAEIQRLNDELHRPPPIVNSSGWVQSFNRSLRMIGYLLFPFGKRRKNKRRKMLAAVWKPK